ncbi:MAG: hypothetical protein ACLUFB_09550 [Ruminococcus sp.]
MIHSKTFLISAIAASLMIIADVVAWFLLYLQGIDVDTSIFYKWLGVNRGMNAGVYFFIALPLLTAFAYSWSVSYDRNSGYISQIITRTSRKKYFTAKFLVTFISGGIIFAGALILDYVLLAIFSPAYTPIPGDLASSMDPFHFCSEIFYQNPYLFMLIWFGIAFLWGGAMSCISMAAGMLIKKYVISSIVPFLVFTAEQILALYVMQRYTITVKGTSIGLVWTDMLYAAPMTTSLPEHILLCIALIIMISTLIYILRGRKYECL